VPLRCRQSGGSRSNHLCSVPWSSSPPCPLVRERGNHYDIFLKTVRRMIRRAATVYNQSKGGFMVCQLQPKGGDLNEISCGTPPGSPRYHQKKYRTSSRCRRLGAIEVEVEVEEEEIQPWPRAIAICWSRLSRDNHVIASVMVDAIIVTGRACALWGRCFYACFIKLPYRKHMARESTDRNNVI